MLQIVSVFISLFARTSAEALSEKVGFPVKDIPSLKAQADETTYLAEWGMAEIQYLIDGHTISYRKSQPSGLICCAVSARYFAPLIFFPSLCILFFFLR